MPKRIVSGDPKGQCLWVEADENGVRFWMHYILRAAPEVTWADTQLVTLSWDEWRAVQEAVSVIEKGLKNYNDHT